MELDQAEPLSNGIEMAEKVFEASLDAGLVRAIRQSRPEKVEDFRDQVVCSQAKRAFAGSEVSRDWADAVPLVEPEVSLRSKTPLVASATFRQLLLIAPRIVAIDPVIDWAEPTIAQRSLESLERLPVQELWERVEGFVGLSSLLKQRQLVLVPGDVDGFGSFPQRFHSLQENLHAKIASGTVTGSVEAQSMERLLAFMRRSDTHGAMQDAFDLDTLAATYEATVVAGRLAPLMLIDRDAVEEIAIELPQLGSVNLEIALGLRSGDETFRAFRSALGATIRSVGRAQLGESEHDYADRLRNGALEHFDGLIGQFRVKRVIGAVGKVSMKGPGAALSFALHHVPFPGLSLLGAAAGAVIEKKVPNPLQHLVDEGVASRAGLAMAVNLQATGWM